MSTNWKIFLGIIFVIIGILLFMIFEIAIDSHNISVANQNKIDSLEYRISFLEEMQKQDNTIKVIMVK